MSKTLTPYSFGIKRSLFLFIVSVFSFAYAFAQNDIVTENALPGNPISDWGVNSQLDFRNVNLNGFTTDISVNQGGTVHFKIDGQNGVPFTIKIYRLGYYGGMGGRLKADLGTFPGVKQPAGISDPVTGMLDCSNWTESATWTVPANAVSGFYVAKLSSAGGINNVVFIVRNDASHSKVFFQASDASWQAYNGYGGNNLYNGTTSFPAGHAVKVSYNRPFFIYNAGFQTGDRGSDWYMNDAYPMIRWMERNGYDVTYTTNTDLARFGSLVLNHKLFIAAGHDEYWSKEMRDNIETARAAGVHLAFFSGNENYWKTRWEADANGNANRVLVCYKEGKLGDGSQTEATCGYKCDVSSPIWTGLWRTGAGYDAPLPENALTGQISWWDSPLGAISVPSDFKNYRFWRNTSIAGLSAGQSATLAPNTLGYEWDFEQYQEFYPHGRITLSTTTLNSHTHKLSLYKDPSGALVFGAGTVQWMWGLDDQHFGGSGNAVSKDMQQATVNLFADMGVQPGSMQTDLVPATASTDVTAPVSVITSPVNGSTIATTPTITISGTSSDANVVAGVEVSVDNGATWSLATGTTSWTYSWAPAGSGNYTIKVRGYDDSGNMEVPGSSGPNVSNITLSASVCTACTIFTTQTPVEGVNNDGQPLEIGVKFRSTSAGYITGVRFYKSSGNTGTHTGELYSSTGTRLAQANFAGETATGWQTVSFSSPVAIAANTTYVAAYFSSAGNYTGSANYLTGAVINSPLTALADGTDGPNSMYKYTAAPAFPSSSAGNKPNYWVDVVFATNAVTGPVANAGSNQTITLPTSSVTLSGSASTGTITSYAWTKISGPNTPTITSPATVSTTVTGLVQGTYVFQLSVNGGASTAQVTITVNASAAPTANAGSNQSIMLPTSSVTLDGSASTGTISSYAWTRISGPNTPAITNPAAVTTTVTGLVQGSYVFQLSLNGGVSTAQVTVTVSAAATGGSTIFTTQIPVATTDNDNTGAVGQELGVKFTSSAAGFITGIRFYKTSGNNGTHIGELYSAAGVRLAQATFTNETSTGWQVVSFSSPVAITANTTYTAAYFSSLGYYTEDNDYFLGHSVSNSPLTAPADGTNGAAGNDPGTGQGTYKYTGSPAFPNQLYRSANYWVDVVYASGSSTPVANAGSNQTITLPASSVTLNGSGSSGTITSYAWTRISGPNTPTITTPSAVSTTVTGLVQGTYVFQLSINGGASTSQVTITVNAAVAAVANAGANQTIVLPASSVSLDGSASTGTITSYLWTRISGPNTPSITTPAAVSTTVTGLVQGVYVFQLSVNGGSSTAQVTITVSAAVSSSSVFTTQIPVATTDNDNTGLVGQELGMKFRSSIAGYITGVRFYKTAGNSGTHIGELYSAAGVRLAQATFTNETATGWQVVSFATPVAITANTTYTVAYFSSLGYYVEDNDYFLNHAEVNTPLTAPADGTNGAAGTDPGTGQGTYKYTAAPAYPNQLYRSANYYVDVIFSTSSGQPLAKPSKSLGTSTLETAVNEVLDYSLGQNFPNPVYANTRIKYSVPVKSRIEMVLYDIQGRQIKILVNEEKEAGTYYYELNTSEFGKGMYYYKMHAGMFQDTKKMVVQ